MRDPQRVCVQCYDILGKAQDVLTATIANHQRLNPIDVDLHTCSVRRYTNLPYSSTLGSELRKAAYSTYNLFNSNWVHDETLVIRLMSKAKGLAFLTVAKVGLVLAPRVGTGLVIARLSDGSWSAPSAIGTCGVSWGALAGVELTDFVVLLNTAEALAAFAGVGQLAVGVGVDVAVGPIGRSGSASLHMGTETSAPAYSYSHSRGLYAGVSLDGSAIFARDGVNHRFYGRKLSPLEILSGAVPPPRAAQPLYDALYTAQTSLPPVTARRPVAPPAVSKSSAVHYSNSMM